MNTRYTCEKDILALHPSEDNRRTGEQVTTWRDLRGLLYSHSDTVCLLIQSNCMELQQSINAVFFNMGCVTFRLLCIFNISLHTKSCIIVELCVYLNYIHTSLSFSLAFCNMMLYTSRIKFKRQTTSQDRVTDDKNDRTCNIKIKNTGTNSQRKLIM
jgi:hypothetical protein